MAEEGLKLADRVAFDLMRAAMGLAALPPLAVSRAWGRGLGRLLHAVDGRHRRIARDNIAASFPEKDAAWADEITRGAYVHLGMVMAELPHLASWSPERIMARVQVHHLDRFVSPLERGGFLVLTGHLGNWEWMYTAAGSLLGGRMTAVGRPIDWAPADRLVNGWRTKTGNRMVPKNRSARNLLRELKGGAALGILLDQNVDWYDGEWVDFFGRPACTNKGLALMHMACGVPVVPAFCFREDDGLFHIYVEPEIPVVDTGDKTQDLWQNTQNYTAKLEEIVRRKPEQWFWLHQRWKTKPYHPWPRQ